MIEAELGQRLGGSAAIFFAAGDGDLSEYSSRMSADPEWAAGKCVICRIRPRVIRRLCTDGEHYE